MKLDSQIPCRDLKFLPSDCGDSILWVSEHRYAREFGINLLEEFEPFASQLWVHLRQPGDVGTGRRKALDEASKNSVTCGCHDDGDRRRSILGCQSVGSYGSDDDVNLEADEIGGEVREAIDSTLCVSVLNADDFAPQPSCGRGGPARNDCASARYPRVRTMRGVRSAGLARLLCCDREGYGDQQESHSDCEHDGVGTSQSSASDKRRYRGADKQTGLPERSSS